MCGVFSGWRLVEWRWILGFGSLATLPVFRDSWLQLQCDQLSFAFATVHTFLTGWTTSPWHVKRKPFHLCLVRFVLTAAGNVTSTASLCMWGGHHLFRSLISTFCWVWLCACMEPELSLLHLITCSGSGLSGCAVVCRLSGERRFPFTCTPANIVVSCEFRTPNGCALFCLGAQGSPGSGVIPEGERQRTQPSPCLSLDLAGLGPLLFFLFLSQPGAQSILSSVSVLPYIWVESSFSPSFFFFKITPLAFKFLNIFLEYLVLRTSSLNFNCYFKKCVFL